MTRKEELIHNLSKLADERRTLQKELDGIRNSEAESYRRNLVGKCYQVGSKWEYSGDKFIKYTKLDPKSSILSYIKLSFYSDNCCNISSEFNEYFLDDEEELIPISNDAYFEKYKEALEILKVD